MSNEPHPHSQLDFHANSRSFLDLEPTVKQFKMVVTFGYLDWCILLRFASDMKVNITGEERFLAARRSNGFSSGICYRIGVEQAGGRTETLLEQTK